MRRSLANLGGALALLTALGGGGALAAEAEVSAPAKRAVGELFGARLRYGVSLRSGGQTDPGPTLTYAGMTPNDVALSGWYFGTGHLGGALSLQREGFALLDPEAGNEKVTSGALLRGHAGASARVAFGPLRLEALVGYGFAQLPLFGSSANPRLAPARRHAVLLASRALVDLGLFSIEARGEYPLPLSVSEPGGAAASASGFAAGASVGIPLGNADRLSYGLVLDYQYVTDSVRVGEPVSSTQTLQRAGAAVELKWLDAPPPPPPPKLGGVLVCVLDADTGKPLPGASVTITHLDEELPLTADGEGKAQLRERRAGPLVARATAGGYLPAEARGEIIPGVDGALELRAKREPPKVGALAITIVDKESKAPIAGAVVTMNDAEYVASEAGAVSLVELPPGPVQLKVSAKGYQPGAEVASVVVGKTSAVPVLLLKEKRRAMATITGQVRSTRGGMPIEAHLELPQAKLKTRANAKGAFTFRVEGGTYTVNISAPGYLAQTKQVTVRDGDQAIFNVDLHPK